MYNLIVTLENESNLQNLLHKTCSRLILLTIHCHAAIFREKNSIFSSQTISFFELFSYCPAIAVLSFSSDNTIAQCLV